jgi:NADH dehydrogenase FAD-containing subunit
VVCDGNSCEINEFSVPYDRLVVTIGAQTNTFGIPGVREYCNFLKQVEDARRIRTAIVNCFERANLPGLTEEERINNLTFAVIGAGPTGIEFAAELRDFVEQDGPKYYPTLLKYVRIKVIEASSTVLMPFDKSLQEEAIIQMNRNVEFKDPNVYRLLPERFKLVELLLDSSVKEVTAKQILLNDGSTIDYGLSVWAAGNGPLPLTLQIVETLGDAQESEQNVARGRIVTDAWLRAKGSHGSILAFGDCSCITNGPDGPLPATGQVAAQQGEYLAKLMNKGFDLSPSATSSTATATIPDGPPERSPGYESCLSESIASFSTGSGEFAKPFQFLNLGILAYTGGGSALAQVPTSPDADPIKGTGKIGNALWKSVYISKQVSWRNRFMVLNDWTRRQIFGRDITRL